MRESYQPPGGFEGGTRGVPGSRACVHVRTRVGVRVRVPESMCNAMQ